MAALLAAVALRVVLGDFDWRDLVVAGRGCRVHSAGRVADSRAAAARQADPLAGAPHELLAAREHRAHHAAPAVLDGVLIPCMRC